MNPDTPIRVFLWSFVGGTTVFTFGCVIILYAQCKPSKAVWTPDYPDPKCWPPEVLTYYSYVAGGTFKNCLKLEGDEQLTEPSTLGLRRPVSGHVPSDGDLAAAAALEEEVGADVCAGTGSLVRCSPSKRNLSIAHLSNSGHAPCRSTKQPVCRD